jgi:signal transduction histidine kinase
MQITDTSSRTAPRPGTHALRTPLARAASDGVAASARSQLLVDDRRRIARDLHDDIIQRLFALGLALSGEASRTRDPETRTHLREATDTMDETIRAVRRSIFHLAAVRDSGLRARMTTTVFEVEVALGFAPRLLLDGPLDTSVSDEVAEHATAVLREALTNVARHAHASSANVDVKASGEWLRIVVTDNGSGLGSSSRLSGVANMRSRAEQLGGTCELTSAALGGTRLEWRVPCSR